MKLPECNFEKFIFVVTGMSYIIDSSGTSKVVQAHEDIFKAHGIGYVAIFPISRSSGEGANWHVKTTSCYAFVIDGQFLSVMTANDVLNNLLQMQERGKSCIGILIHHIIRNDITEVQWMLEKIQNVPVVYYLHDFYTCCINPNMLKNDVESCVDGGVSCEGCGYAQKRQEHLKTVNAFLGLFGDRISFVAPSEYVRNRWITYHPEYRDRVTVVPHQRSIGQYTGNKESIPDSEPMRIGFVGAQTHVKGWDIFKRTVAKLQEAGCNYEYYYFGLGQEQLPKVTNIPIEIAKMGKDAMTKAIREKRISAVFLVCVGGETYSYTMYESHAANSYILTMSKSGNIAYTVGKKNWGRVFETEDDLVEALLDEKNFRETINEWIKRAEPGAAEYEDNDSITEVFSMNHGGRITWMHKATTPVMAAKRMALNKLFIETRLKNGK